MSRTVVHLDDEALSLASEDNERAGARMLEILDETGTDLSDEALHGAWRDGGRA